MLDGRAYALVEEVFAQRAYGASQVPLLALLDALLHIFEYPLAQLLVVGYLLDERVGRAREDGIGAQFEVVVKVDAQLLDKGSQDALEKFINRENGKVRVVVQNTRLKSSCALGNLLARKA